MTPDPSAVPITVWITGFAGSGLDEVRLIVATVGLGLIVCVALLAALVMSAGMRRTY